MSWRYLAYDLVTEAFVTELTASAWSSTDELNGTGAFSATILLDDTTTLTGTTPAKTLIVAERDGVPEFAGIPWRRRYDANTRSLTVAGAGLLSFFDHLKPGADYTPTNVDQLTIFATLAARGSEIGIVTHGETSGRLRTRSNYLRLANKRPGEFMRELAAVVDGFDFDFRVEYIADAPVRTQRLFYPRRGRSVATSNVRFRVPGNASIVAVDEDATGIASEVVAFGAGVGVDMIESVRSSTDLLAAGYPAYGATVSYKDVSSQTTLDEHVAAELRDRSAVDVETFTLEVDPSDIGHPYGSWTLGDDAYIIIEDDPRFPAQSDGTPGLVRSRRIVSHTWDVSGSGEELSVGLDLITAVRSVASSGAGVDPDVDRRIRSLEGV